MKLSKNFDSKEFACPCCGGEMISGEVAYKLQALRDLIGLPIYVSSGYRCKKENKKVWGDKNSPHLEGVAVDIIVKDFDFRKVAKLALKVRFKRVGLYPSSRNKFLHLDIKPPSPSQAWIRWKNGKYTYYGTLKTALGVLLKVEKERKWVIKG